MKQPKQHTIGRVAGRYFISAVPGTWPARKQSEDDYGIDYDVEIFKQQGKMSVTTGVIFKAQVKGTEKISLSDDGSTVSCSLGIDKGMYLIEEITIPALFVVCDVNSGHCYWTEIQSNSQIIKTFRNAKERNQKNFTIYLPTTSNIKDDKEKIIKAVTRCIDVLSLRQFTKCSIPEFVASAKLLDEDKILKEMKLKSSALKYAKIENLIRAQDRNGVSQTINMLLQDPDTTTELKFAATLAKQNLYLLDVDAGQESKDKLDQVCLTIYHEALEIVKDGPPHLKTLASLLISASELTIITWKDYHLYISWKLHQEDGDSFWILNLIRQRSDLASKILVMYRACDKQLGEIISHGYFSVFPQSARRVCEAISPFITRLRLEELDKTAEGLVSWTDSVLQIAKDIATRLELWSEVGSVAQVQIMLANLADPIDIKRRFALADEWISSITDIDERKREQKSLDEVRNFQKPVPGEQHMNIDDEQEFYHRHIRTLGVNLDDNEDDLGRLVKIAIEDLNPERVLRDCKHLFVRLVNISPVGNWLKLPTMGLKEIKCLLHKYGIQGFALDATYSSFKQEYCNKCTDKKPRLNDWKWSREWQQEQDQKFLQGSQCL